MPNAATPLLNRGTCYLKLKKFYEALEDFTAAIGLNADLELAYYRKGVVYFELEEYESAKKTFEAGLLLRKKNYPKRDQTQYSRYIRKCDAELSEEAEIKVDTKPAPAKPAAAATTAPPAPKPVVAAVAPQQQQSLQLPVRYQYYQSDVALNISVLAKNLAPEDVVVDIKPEHLRVVIKYKTFNGDQKEEVVIDKDLFDTVDVEKSKYSVLKPKVEIQLIKVSKDVWPSLEHNGAPRLPKPAASSSASSSSSSSSSSEAMDVDGAAADPAQPIKRPKAYASNKDWDRLGSEISKELDAEKPEGDAALQDLFSKIYKDADEETKMAMKKSFQTSGGTVLSTNWKEVKDKDYEKERQAPKGMEWRNWEGDRLEQVDD